MTDQTDLAALVKPLVWKSEIDCLWEADGLGVLYRVLERHDGTGRLWIDTSWSRQADHPTPEAAKAAAQADYERRALEPLTVIDAKALVKAALERATGIADRHLSYVKPHHPDDPGPNDIAQGYGNAALNVREAIRALADNPEAVAGIIEQVKGESDD